MRNKKVTFATGVAITACMLIGAAPAGAATPATHACMGQSVSAFSSAYTRSGWAYRDFAQDPESAPGLGDAVQAVQAGLVPDTDFPNVCNG